MIPARWPVSRGVLECFDRLYQKLDRDLTSDSIREFVLDRLNARQSWAEPRIADFDRSQPWCEAMASIIPHQKIIGWIFLAKWMMDLDLCNVAATREVFKAPIYFRIIAQQSAPEHVAGPYNVALLWLDHQFLRAGNFWSRARASALRELRSSLAPLLVRRVPSAELLAAADRVALGPLAPAEIDDYVDTQIFYALRQLKRSRRG